MNAISLTASVYANLFFRTRISHVCQGIYVGQVPIEHTPWIWDLCVHSHSHIIDFVKTTTPDRDLGAVVTILDHKEMNSFCGIQLTSTNTWEKAGVAHIFVNMIDLQAILDHQQARLALRQAADIYKTGKAVYFHCRAGRSRSVMMASAFICWLLKFTFEDTLSLLMKNRKEMLLYSDLEKQNTAQKLLRELEEEDKQIRQIEAAEKQKIDETHDK